MNGDIAKSGNVNKIILDQYWNIFQTSNSDKKSYDISDFDISFVKGLSLEDGAATLSAFTTKIISSSIDFLLREFDKKDIKIIISGGGRKNKNLIKNIKSYSKKNLLFYSSENYKLNGDFIESQAFAYLAIRAVLSLPISFPKTTGCNTPCTGGKIIEI